MRGQQSVFLSLVSLLLLPFPSAFAQSAFEAPTAVIFADNFSPIRSEWQPVTGQWSVSKGTYGQSLADDTYVSLLTHYRGLSPDDPGDTKLTFRDFTLRARVRVQLPSRDAGIVYGYQDSQNYYEAVIAPSGAVQVRSVINGSTNTLGQLDTGITSNTWVELEVHWKSGVTIAKVNGRLVTPVAPVNQPEFTTGQAGLVTHASAARFDKFFISVPFGDQSFLERFDESHPLSFAPTSGQWSIVDGSYRSAVQQTSISLAPIHTGGAPRLGDTFEYTFRARLSNPYGAFGNLVGIVFNYGNAGNYTELTFSPTGIAKLNRVVDGVLHNVATENYGGRQNHAFEVGLENGPTHFAVTVDGMPFFQNVDIFDVNPQQFPEGGVGLITHWSPGRFDNVQFDYGFFSPCSTTFDNRPPFNVVSGLWDTTGGTLNSTAVGSSDIVDLVCFGNSQGDDAGTNEVYSARLLNQFNASGNLVGLLYNYQDSNSFYAGDYFEVVFSPTGFLQMNKLIEGVRYPVIKAGYDVPPNTWFDVQVIRTGINTTIQVNGKTVLANIRQGDLRGGSIGVVTHWAKGRFDNVSLTPHVTRPASELP